MSRGCCFLAAILSLLAVAADGAPAADLPRARLLREIYPGPMGAGVSFAGVLNGTLLFYAEDPEHGRELWRSDGTFAGTTLVRDLLPGPESGIGYGDSTMFGDLLAFPVSYSASGAQLWRSDGTEEGTVLVRNLAPGVANSSASLLTPAGERLWFTVQSDFWDQEKRGTEDLWSTDLTPQGTERLSEVGSWEPGFSGGATTSVTSIRPLADGALLARQDRSECCEQVELRRYDHLGMDAAFLFETHSFSHHTSLPPLEPLVGGNTAYFLTGDEYRTRGCNLWRTDGADTTAIEVGDRRCGYWALGVIGTDLLLSRQDVGGRAKIFRATPSEAALTLVADLGEGHISEWSAITAPGGLYFVVFRADSRELWRAHSPTAPPSLLRRFEDRASGSVTLYGLTPAEDGVLFWLQDPEIAGVTLWRSTGSAESTAATASVPAGAQPSQVTESGSLLFLSAFHAAQGWELWIVDRRPTPPPQCGDCDGAPPVLGYEVVAALEIALGVQPYGGCLYVDANSDLRVSIDELVVAVREKLVGCGVS